MPGAGWSLGVATSTVKAGSSPALTYSTVQYSIVQYSTVQYSPHRLVLPQRDQVAAQLRLVPRHASLVVNPGIMVINQTSSAFINPYLKIFSTTL